VGAANKQGMAILIVDDESDVRTALRRSLRRHGFEIHEAEDGVAALDFLKDHDVDAVLSDFDMPRMNGLDLMQRLRIAKPHIARVILSARSDVNVVVRALNEGSVHRFLLKPWDSVDLAGILQMTLRTMERAQGEAK